MKIHHLEGRSYEELSEFRKNIWKILLTNSRNVVRTLQLTLEHVDHAVNVRSPFPLSLSLTINMSVLAGQLRVHHEPPSRHPQS